VKFTVNQTSFKKALSIVGTAVPSRATHPILNNFFIEATEDKLTIIGFDTVIGIKTSIQSITQESGLITIPATILNNIISKLQSEEITIEIKDNRATITTESGHFDIGTMPATDYPEFPDVPESESIFIPLVEFTESLKAVSFAASTEETKMILTGIHIKPELDSVEFAATDSHRLSVTRIEHDLGDTAKPVTISLHTIKTLEKVLSECKGEENIYLKINESTTFFTCGDYTVIGRVLQGKYPAYQQLIPKSFTTTATIPRKELIRKLELVSTIVNQGNHLTVFSFVEEKLTISAEGQDIGKGEDSLAIELSGNDIKVGFNCKYLIDGLKTMLSDSVRFSLNTPVSPVIIEPLDSSKTIFLVMPVSIIK